MRPDIVIKIGGSLVSDLERLSNILKQVSESPARVMVVPGGGGFADAVRALHQRIEFCDAVAHDMAVLATHQTGLLFHALQSQLRPVRDLEGLRDAFGDGEQAVVLAEEFLKTAGQLELPRSWSSTSDAIAAWLAVELDVAELIYVKSCSVPSNAPLKELREHRVLDPVCVDVLFGTSVHVRCLGPEDDGLLSRLLLQSSDADFREL